MNTTNIGAKKEDSPEYFEPDDDKALPISEVLGGNVIKAPVKFQRPEPLPDDEDEDEEDLDIEALDSEFLEPLKRT